MKKINQKLYYCIDNLYDELERNYNVKSVIDYETQFGELITVTTRLKIINELILIFKMIKKNTDKQIILEKLLNVKKRIKLHFKQLKKLKQKNINENIEYFTMILKIIYSYVIFKGI